MTTTKQNVAHLHLTPNGRRVFKTLDGKNVSNRNVDGKPMNQLPIPPNLTDVVVYMDKNSPILYTGKSAIGKTQYTYRTWHVEKSDYKKFCLLLDFERKLPAIMERVNVVLAQPKLSKEKVVALILRIVYSCNFRVGTKSKQTTTEAKGITTLEKKDIKLGPDGIVRIEFEGKSRAHNECTISDPLVHAALRQLDRLTSTNTGNRGKGNRGKGNNKGNNKNKNNKGNSKNSRRRNTKAKTKTVKREFFFSIPEHMDIPRKYEGVVKAKQGKKRATRKRSGFRWYRISHLDVNDFLKDFNVEFTSKMFRTWNANMLFEKEAAAYVGKHGIGETDKARKAELKDIIGRVAARLHHTVAISRKKYIIPQFTDLYQNEPAKFMEFAAKKKPFITFLKSYCAKCNDGNCRN